jgi:ubiquinone/menaquinone biosynthesis C-methylase UbiE
LDILRERLGCISGGRILDVATGDGSFVRLLADNLKDYSEIIGIDVDESAVTASREKNSNNRITFAVMSGDCIRFEDNGFDTVAISNSLHHLADLENTLGEMRRVLKPGGLVVINEVFSDGQNEKQLTHAYLHELHAEVDAILGIPHRTPYRKQEIVDIARDMGLEDLRYFVHENDMFNRNVQVDMFAQRYRNFVDRLKGYPQYGKYAARLAELVGRLNTIGVEFASQVMIMGTRG